MYSVEREFGFCFTNEEWDRTFSLDELVGLIEKKLANPKHAYRFASDRLAQARSLFHPILQIAFTSLIFAVPVVVIRVPAVRFSLMVVWAGITAIIVYSWFQGYAHFKRIVERSRGAVG